MRERWQMFAENWSVGRFLGERFGTNRGQDSNRHATRDATGHLQQVGFDVDDLVFAVPFAGEEVLEAIRLEPDGAVDKAVLVLAGVVPERVRVPE
jgi:hypothetical protein